MQNLTSRLQIYYNIYITTKYFTIFIHQNNQKRRKHATIHTFSPNLLHFVKREGILFSVFHPIDLG